MFTAFTIKHITHSFNSKLTNCNLNLNAKTMISMNSYTAYK